MPLLMQTLHLIQNVISSLRIKPRSRLIEHEHIRLHRKDPGDRHTALLPARKLKRRLFKILFLQSDKPQCLIRTPLDLLLWKTEILRAKADVCKYIDLKQLVLRILEYQPDLAAQLLDALLGLRHTLTPLESERLRDDADGQHALLTRDLRHDGGRAGAGAAAHAGGDEHHVRVLERLADLVAALLGRLASDIGVRARALSVRSKKSYRDKRVKNDPSDWLIFENTHEAIVDPETWQLAQQVKRTVRRTDTTGVANPLTGLVFCADCGAKMYNHRGKRKKDGREYGTDFYNCSTYTLTFERETQMCFSHTVSTKALNALILETIRTTASYAIQNKEEFIQKVRSISQVRQQEAAKELKRKVAKERRRSAELDVLIKKLYETYAMGKLEEKRFELLCAEYEKEQAELEQLLASEQAQLNQFHEDTDRASHFLALAQKYTDFTELTAPMIHEFVEKILVHAPDRSTGERVQEIEIYLNFIGKFEVPMPEPTEEELAAEEKRRQKRIRDHEKYLRQKERKQKIAEGLIVPGEPYQLVCQCCGEPFQSVRPNAKFCKPACREKFYRQEKRKAKETETSQTA